MFSGEGANNYFIVFDLSRQALECEILPFKEGTITITPSILLYEMKIFSSNNRSYKVIFSYFFLIVEGHSKHYFNYIMSEYPVITSCHKKTTFKMEGQTTQGPKHRSTKHYIEN